MRPFLSYIMNNNETKPNWNCPACGEAIEDNFNACWKCGTGQDGAKTPDFTPETEVDISENSSEYQAGIRSYVIAPGLLCCFFLAVTVLITIFQNQLPSYSEYLIGLGFTATFCAAAVLIFGLIISLADPPQGDSPKTYQKFQPDLIQDKKLCHNCLEPNFPREHFCVKCAAPLTSHAEIDPLGQVYALGDTYRKAAQKPTRPFVVWAMWLLLGPQIPYLLWALLVNVGEWIKPIPSYDDVYQISPLSRPPSFFATSGGVALILLLIFIYAAILYKVTKNYTQQKQVSED